MAETNGSEVTAPLTVEQASELIRLHTIRMYAELYRIGRICNELVTQGVAGQRCYSNVALQLGPWLKELARADLYRAFEVARTFSQEDCVKYGPRRLHLLMQYMLKHELPLLVQDPGFTLITVPQEDGTLLRKPFCECTEEELGSAISRSRRQRSGRPSRAEAHCVQRLRDGLQKRSVRSPRKGVLTTVREGRLHVTLKEVPVTDLEPLVGALLESLEPLHEELGRTRLERRPRSGFQVPFPAQSASAPGHSQAER